MAKNTLLKAVWELSRFWLCCIALLILFSVMLFIYQSQFVASKSERLQRQQSQLQSQLSRREAQLAESGVPVSDVEQMERDLLKFSQLIPNKQNFSDFIGELFSMAQDSTLEIRQVSYQPEIDEESHYLKYGLNFSVEGSYSQLKKFIHFLENSQRILIVDKIELSGRPSKENSATVNLQINMTTFFQEGTR